MQIFVIRTTALVILISMIVMSVFSRRGLGDWRRMEEQNRQLQVRILEAEVEKNELKRRILRLQNDRFEQEKVVRQVLGYIGKGETVIEF